MAGKQYLEKPGRGLFRYCVGPKFGPNGPSRTVAEIKAFGVLSRNSRWPPKMTKKLFLAKSSRRLCMYPVGQNFFLISLCHTISEINVFLSFT